MKRTVLLILVGMLCISLAACSGGEGATDQAQSDQPKVGVSLLNKAHVFYNKIEAGLVDKAAELEYSLIIQDASGDANKQMNQVQDFITQKVDAIILCPTNSAGSKSMVELAAAAGIPVFTMDIMSDGDTVCHVATDNYKGGSLAAEYMVNNMMTDKRGDVAVITYSEIESCIEREKGFTDWVAANAPDVNVVAIQNYSGDQAKAADIMQNMLLMYENLEDVFCVGDPAAAGAMASITTARRQVKVMGFDGNPEAVEAILDGGLWVASIAQNPTEIGFTTLQAIKDHLDGKDVPKVIPIAPYVLDASNAK